MDAGEFVLEDQRGRILPRVFQDLG